MGVINKRNIGALRKKITIQVVTETPDITGDPIKTWNTFAGDRWAKVEPIGGQEFFTAQQFLPKFDTKFVLRFVKGVKPKMRVVYNGDNYDIISVVNVEEANRELDLLCQRIVT